MRTALRALGLALLSLWMGCADFDVAEQGFCERNPLRCAGIEATVVLDPAVRASCIHVEVRDPTTHVSAAENWVPRGNQNELRVPITRGSLPKDVEIAAQPYLDGDCENNTVARTVNGVFVTVTASFVEGQLVRTTLPKMLPGEDSDNDGYVNEASGGADCQDGVAGVNPGVKEQCSDQEDLNCDTKPGCETSACGLNSCFGSPASLALTLLTPVTAGTCTPGTVGVKSANGGNSRATTTIPVDLESNPTGGIAFYSDSGCKTPIQNSIVSIAQGEAETTFYFQGQTVGTVTVSATAKELMTASQSVQVKSGTGNQLVFVSPAQQVTAGSCSGAVQVQSQNEQGTPLLVTTATPVTLTATPNTSFQFFSSSTCSTGTELGSATIAAGSSTASFYFRATKAGAVSVTAAASGFTGNTQSETIKPGQASIVILTGASTVTAGDCTQTKVDITLRDIYSNPTTATANTTVTLSASGKPLTFSTSSGCGTTISSVVLGSGQATVSFFFRGTQAGSSTIIGSAAGLTNGTLNVTMNAAAPSTHAFATAPQTVQAGNCSSVVTVQSQDSFGNPAKVASNTTVALSASSPNGFPFFAEAGCSGSAVSNVTIPIGASDVSFSFRSTLAQPVAVTAIVSGTSKSQNETITAGAPSRLAFVTAPQSVAQSACSAITTVQVQDSFGNGSATSSILTIDLAEISGLDTHFYADPSCLDEMFSVQVSSGQTTGSFYFLNYSPTDRITITASSPNLGSALQHETIF